MDLNFDLNETPEEKGMEDLIRGYFPESVIFDNNTNIQEYALKTYNDLINHKEDNKTKYEVLLIELNKNNKIKKIRKEHSGNDNKKALFMIDPEDIYPYEFSFKDKEFFFDETKRFFYKKYDFDTNNAFLSVLREIILHKYAFHLLEKYKKVHFPYIDKIKIPELYEIFYNDSENIFSPLKKTNASSLSPINNEINNENKSIIIKYELLDIYTLLNNVINENIEKKWFYYFTLITDVFEYFEKNKLFHNDTKRDNLCFLRDEYKIEKDNVKKTFNKIAIIDFGEATLLEQRNYQQTGFTKKKVFQEIVYSPVQKIKKKQIEQSKSLTSKKQNNNNSKTQKNIINKILKEEKKSFNAWFKKSDNNPIKLHTQKYGGKHQKKTHNKTHKKTKRNKRKQIKTKKQYNKTK